MLRNAARPPIRPAPKWAARPRWHNGSTAAAAAGAAPAHGRFESVPETTIKFLRMKPGHGEVLLAEGDPRVREEEERLVEEFRRQLDEGMWAAVPTTDADSGRREAQLVKHYEDIPTGAERVIFFPRASGG